MASIAGSITELIGNTPLMRLNGYAREQGLKAAILGKLEYFNPAGSCKDRVALSMIEDAEQTGKLTPGAVIIEPTSGNTGIGLAAVAAAKGYRLILTMPETMSIERRKLAAAYGAQVVLTDGAKGMQGAIAKAEQLAAEMPGAFLAGQFENPANPRAHEKTTGPEIWKDTDGDVDIFVAGVGTGGTISGAGAYLKSQKPALQIVAVEPTDSPVLSGGKPGAHALQGMGAGFIPKTLNTSIFDEVLQVSKDEAFAAARAIVRSEGLLLGISSGAALHAATVVAQRPENAGKTIVVLFPDTGERYLSTPVFEG